MRCGLQIERCNCRLSPAPHQPASQHCELDLLCVETHYECELSFPFVYVLQVVIVEEEGEVFEAHILASFAPTTEHLILIGDHEQLRPKPQLYALQASHVSTVRITGKSCPIPSGSQDGSDCLEPHLLVR